MTGGTAAQREGATCQASRPRRVSLFFSVCYICLRSRVSGALLHHLRRDRYLVTPRAELKVLSACTLHICRLISYAELQRELTRERTTREQALETARKQDFEIRDLRAELDASKKALRRFEGDTDGVASEVLRLRHTVSELVSPQDCF